MFFNLRTRCPISSDLVLVYIGQTGQRFSQWLTEKKQKKRNSKFSHHFSGRVSSEAKCRCHPHWCGCMINLLNHRNSPHVILQAGKWSVDQRLGWYNKVFSDNKISVSSQLSISTIPYTFEWKKDQVTRSHLFYILPTLIPQYFCCTSFSHHRLVLTV